jgi:hypothetical protein
MTAGQLIAVASIAIVGAYLILAGLAIAGWVCASRAREQRDEARAHLATARTKLAATERRHGYLRPISPVVRHRAEDALTSLINRGQR